MFPVQRYIQRKVISDLGRSLPNGDGFKGFIRGQSYVLEYDEEGEDLFIGGVNEGDFVSALSHDYSRFALSGIESYERALRAVGESNTAWPAIQIYYSAYYFANSIMRACGVNVSRLKFEESRALNELRLLFDLECGNIPTGDYRATWVPSASLGPKIKLEPISAGTGAHEKFWIVFSSFLRGLIEEIRQQGMPDALDAENSAGDLLRLLRACGSGNHNWLSNVRNDITYQHQYGVWTPTSKRSQDVKSIRALRRKEIGVVRLDHNPNVDPMNAFLAGCQYLIELGILVATHLATFSKRNGAFGAQWARCLDLSQA